MSETKTNNPIKNQAKFYGRKMLMSRFIGIIGCLMAIASIVLYYLRPSTEWLSMITIGYCTGLIFTANSFLQDIKIGNPWQRINAFCAVILYLFTVFLIVYGFVEGGLTMNF